jgi:hypothetical protein
MRVEFRAQDLDVGNTAAPERAKYISNKDVLNDAFTQSRMGEVTIFRRHAASVIVNDNVLYQFGTSKD